MVHNISSEGIVLMKEYAARYYGVNPEQIVVRHDYLRFNTKNSFGWLRWYKDNLYYVLDCCLSSGVSDFDFSFFFNEKYMSADKFEVTHYKAESFELDKDFYTKGFYFNGFEMVESAEVVNVYVTALRFNII